MRKFELSSPAKKEGISQPASQPASSPRLISISAFRPTLSATGWRNRTDPLLCVVFENRSGAEGGRQTKLLLLSVIFHERPVHLRGCQLVLVSAAKLELLALWGNDRLVISVAMTGKAQELDRKGEVSFSGRSSSSHKFFFKQSPLGQMIMGGMMVF